MNLCTEDYPVEMDKLKGCRTVFSILLTSNSNKCPLEYFCIADVIDHRVDLIVLEINVLYLVYFDLFDTVLVLIKLT